jgi:hypothetical protein
VKDFSEERYQKNKARFFITRAAYYSIELNAHALLSIALLVCQHELPEQALSISNFAKLQRFS